MKSPIHQDGVYQKTVLDSGVRVVTEYMPQVRSLAVGFWFDVGSRDEAPEVAGISHFLEHMNFKGTPRRNAAAIVRQIEGRGGHINAFTGKEVTCFYVRAIDSQLPTAVDVLADITLNSVYDPQELERERGVILEELKNIEDTPDEWVVEHFFRQVFDGHPLGRPVIGERPSLGAINRDSLLKFSRDHYRGKRTVVAAAGNLNHRRLVNLVEKHFRVEPGTPFRRRPPRSVRLRKLVQDLHTSTQQAHICWGCRSLKFSDPRKYQMMVLSTVLGGGMSSRLFQQIRERHGLAYSVFSFAEPYWDSGVLCVYAGTEPKQAHRAVKMIEKVALDLVNKPLSSLELQRTKDQLKGAMLLSLESPSSRMQRLARSEIYTREWRPLDAIIADIDAVKARQVQDLAAELFQEGPLFQTILWPET